MQSTFTRQELKFIIDRSTFGALMRELPKHTEPDKHNKNHRPYPIYSIYFDTPDSDLARMSFDKERYYRYKIRVRSYHDFTDQQEQVFLEIKKKVNGISNKRRIRLPYHEALVFIKNGTLPAPSPHINPQIVREMQHYFASKHLQSTTHVTYNRYAFTGEPNLRITLDTDVVATNYSDHLPQKLLKDGQYILEIKARGAMPLWLAHWLSAHHIFEHSFSKYGKSYINKLRKESLQYV
ncbi:MAG: polyphosphate polymerase domain-containing protein [Candidatus Nomurabacteria bacterium]|nr:polyphosphate polymerase domain-containing protein [Candidatus Nomurabacteria bacterium]